MLKKTIHKFAIFQMTILIFLISSCSLLDFNKPSLYERLGGKTAIEAVVADFTNTIVNDDRIDHFFAETDQEDFKSMLVAQICEAAGGPCVYEGADMKSAHEGLEIREADFNALVEDLIKTLDKFKVPQAEKNELLELLGPMKSDIVEPVSSTLHPKKSTNQAKPVVQLTKKEIKSTITAKTPPLAQTKNKAITTASVQPAVSKKTIAKAPEVIKKKIAKPIVKKTSKNTNPKPAVVQKVEKKNSQLKRPAT